LPKIRTVMVVTEFSAEYATGKKQAGQDNARYLVARQP
jgi:hypothetical protein